MDMNDKDNGGVEESLLNPGESAQRDGDIPMRDDSDEGGADAAAERRKRRKAKSKYSSLMENDDLEKMLTWKNGIGYLPDSNLRFRKSDIGSLEVVSPSSDDDDDENDLEDEVQFNNTNKRQRRRTRSKQDLKSPLFDTPSSTPPPMGGQQGESSEKRNRKDRKKKKFSEDELLKCETCGNYGLISEFRSSGRFCSQRCVGAYASKKRAEMIQTQLDNGERKSITPNKKHGGPGRKKKYKDNSPSLSPTVNKSKKANFWKEPIGDDSTLYYKTVGFEAGFCWNTYLQITGARSAPLDAFYREYVEQDLLPDSKKILPGMKLECIDPKHQSLFCCCTVVEVQGGRLRLNFDGWSPSYDFWINANSFFLHPCGWCERNGQKLQPPKGMDTGSFTWASYLEKTNSVAVPDHLFYEPPPVARHGFRTCMKLEAVDRKNPDLVCVASINNVMGDQFLIHFDEWDDLYDYWCRHDNPYIHAMGWCQDNGITLVPPTDEMVGKFVWEEYLDETDTIAAPKDIFRAPQKILFETGDKLEVIDPRNQSLCRVATVNHVEDFRIKIHFDGWQSIYDFWFDFDSTELHPVGWCAKSGHPLEPPPSNRDAKVACGVPGCRGIGHIKGAKYTTHHTSFGCPYTAQNINRSTSPVIDRLAIDSIESEGGKLKPVPSPVEEIFPDSTTNNVKPSIGRPKKQKSVKNTIRKRKRRGSDEVSSSTNIEERTLHKYNPMDRPKKIRPTHLPAGRNPNNGHQVLSKSRAIPWGMTEVADFLMHLGYEDLVPAFKDNQIDGQALLLLSQADLVHHLKLKLGPALKIYSEISKL